MGILIKSASTPTRGTVPAGQHARRRRRDCRRACIFARWSALPGLRREQLYMWQRRYGFPAPLRDPFGDRVYPPDQVARLRLDQAIAVRGLARRCRGAARRHRAAIDARA